jgi:hypothetical protein
VSPTNLPVYRAVPLVGMAQPFLALRSLEVQLSGVRLPHLLTLQPTQSVEHQKKRLPKSKGALWGVMALPLVLALTFYWRRKPRKADT